MDDMSYQNVQSEYHVLKIFIARQNVIKKTLNLFFRELNYPRGINAMSSIVKHPWDSSPQLGQLGILAPL